VPGSNPAFRYLADRRIDAGCREDLRCPFERRIKVTLRVRTSAGRTIFVILIRGRLPTSQPHLLTSAGIALLKY